MATEERFIVNQKALRNLTDTTGFGEALANLEGFHLMIVGHHGSLVSVGATVTTTAAFTAPPTRARSFLQTIIDDIDRLELRSNYHFRPSKHAMRSAKLYIIHTYARMRASFPRPSFVLDGERGIVIKWELGGHSVRLNCFGDPHDDDYIYFENNEFDVEDNVTPEVLHNRLTWLLRHEREPVR